MKKILILCTLSFILIGCKANYPVAQQSGKEDVAYLLFVGSKDYSAKEVQVVVDEAQPLTVQVIKPKKANRKGTLYGVSTGTRNLRVYSDGNILYQKKVFLSPQEVKQITLP